MLLLMMIMPPGNAQPSTSSNGVLGEAAGGVHPGVWEDDHFLGWRLGTWKLEENMGKHGKIGDLVPIGTLGKHGATLKIYDIWIYFEYIWCLLEGTSSSRFKWLWNEGTPWYTSFSGAPWWRWAYVAFSSSRHDENPPKKHTNTSQIISICFGKLGIGVLSSGEKGSAKCLDSVSWWCNSIWNSSGHQRLDGKISGARS